MLKPSFILIAIVVAISFSSCKQNEASQAAIDAFEGVIPKPVIAKRAGNTSITLKSDVTVYGDKSTGVSEVGKFLAGEFGLKQSEERTGDQLYLVTISDSEIGDEGYIIDVTENSVSISANKPVGLFYGVQTLRQMAVKTEKGWEIATGQVKDYPSYGWRGSMMDLGRHFFPVEDVKKYIDYISAYKMNVLHLHLSDDQGWRIEIKSWPDLTAIGSKTSVKGQGGGFFTQEQYKDIVAYAESKFVTIIPEVDLPGHTNAALASYPSLNLSGKAPALYEGIEVGFSTLSLDKKIKETTLKFINDVVRELAEITPGPYIHIGGDEAAATKKEEYLEFVKIFKKVVEANGKHMVGWEEIAQSDIGPGDVAQHWASKKHAEEAIQKGARVVMSPSTKIYLDMKYDTTTKLGQKWAAIIEVDDSYKWKVSDMIPGVPFENVVGIEAPIWTETLSKLDSVEFMVFPRLPGVAEIAWTPDSLRSWDEYKNRLARHGAFMEAMGINYYRSPRVDWKK